MKHLLLAGALIALSSASALAQSAMTTGQPLRSSMDQLRVEAARPSFQGGSAVRIMFRVRANGEAELPIVAMEESTLFNGTWAQVYGSWTAYTAGGRQCIVDEANVQGIQTYPRGVQSLPEESGSATVASPAGPLMLVANFRCDGPVEPSDTITAQVQFYVLRNGRWAPAAYVFEDMAFAGR